MKQKWEEKLLGYFKQKISEISREKTWTLLRKGSLKRETETLIKIAKTTSQEPTMLNKNR